MSGVSQTAEEQCARDAYMQNFSNIFSTELVQLYEADGSADAVQHLTACIEAGIAGSSSSLRIAAPSSCARSPSYYGRCYNSSCSSGSARPSSHTDDSSSAAALTKDEMEEIVRFIENDPRILMEIVTQLEPQNRRRLVVAGGAMEWFGKDSAATEVEKADLDKDRQISPKDFDHWFESALKQRREDQLRRAKAADAASQSTQFPAVVPSSSSSSNDAGGSGATSAVQSTAAATGGMAVHEANVLGATKVAESRGEVGVDDTTSRADSARAAEVRLSILLIVAVEAALPFVGFGFLDNAIMILAGDAIDSTLGFYLNCSVLASAAMGNVCSGVFGMQVHGLIDKVTQRLFRTLPVLTEAQMKNRRVFLAGHIGGTLGIMVGLLLGMFPLLFLQGDGNEKSDYAMFQRWDVGKSGFIEMPELEQVLAELELTDVENIAQAAMKQYGTDNKISYEQFIRLKDNLRKGHNVFDDLCNISE